jgi:3-oxoacyl-[acyl-carrier-protein] synthase-3
VVAQQVRSTRPPRCGGRPTTIRSLATYVPPRLLTNADLEKLVETSDEWILQRTGIRERHIVDPGVATSDLGKEAAVRALANAQLSPDDIGVIVVGTVTPDMLFPSTACLIQHKIGARHAWGFDLSAACSAFTYSLTTASQLVASGAHDHALVVGADVMSSIIDYQDRSTCVLFGDGAGAVVVSAANGDDGAILDFEHEIDGGGGHRVVHAGRRQPAPRLARDDRPAAALREAGRPDGLPLRGPENGGKSRAVCSSGTA